MCHFGTSLRHAGRLRFRRHVVIPSNVAPVRGSTLPGTQLPCGGSRWAARDSFCAFRQVWNQLQGSACCCCAVQYRERQCKRTPRRLDSGAPETYTLTRVLTQATFIRSSRCSRHSSCTRFCPLACCRWRTSSVVPLPYPCAVANRQGQHRDPMVSCLLCRLI